MIGHVVFKEKLKLQNCSCTTDDAQTQGKGQRPIAIGQQWLRWPKKLKLSLALSLSHKQVQISSITGFIPHIINKSLFEKKFYSNIYMKFKQPYLLIYLPKHLFLFKSPTNNTILWQHITYHYKHYYVTIINGLSPFYPMSKGVLELACQLSQRMTSAIKLIPYRHLRWELSWIFPMSKFAW